MFSLKPAKELRFCKKQSDIHYVVLGESLIKASVFYEFSPPHIHNRDMEIRYFPSFNFKGKMLPTAENNYYQALTFHIAFPLLRLNGEMIN